MDTSGQEKFNRLGLPYFKNCSSVLLVYDISNRESFANIPNWIEICNNNSPQNVLKVLVGNKCDLEERQVSKEEGQKFANENGMLFFETSAHTGKNVEKLFLEIAQEIDKKMKEKKKNQKKRIMLLPIKYICY